MNAQHSDAEYEQADAEELVGRDNALSRLDQEVTRYHKALDDLEKCLHPVMSQRAETDEEPSVKPMPTSELRGRADKLGALTGRLERIVRDLDL